MKKKICIITLLTITFFCFSTDFEDFLKKAINSYNSGDTETALQNIDAAKKILDEEKLQNGNNEYIEVANWDVVKLKKDIYLEKKVKVTTMYSGVTGTQYIVLSGPGICNFNEQLVDKILTLEKLKKYTFYGTVKDSWTGPTLFVEAIE